MKDTHWKQELKKYLYLLSAKDERDILDYYDELFADYYEQGLTYDEIVEQLGPAKEVAKKLVSDFIEDHEAINNIEQDEREGKIEKSKSFKKIMAKVGNSLARAGTTVKNKWNDYSTKNRRRNSKLNKEEAERYEREVQEQMEKRVTKAEREKEEYAKKAKEAERVAELAKEEARLAREELDKVHHQEKEKEKMKYKETYVVRGREKPVYVRERQREEDERPIIIEDYGPKKTRYYTLSERKSLLSNIFYLIFMFIFLTIGAGILAYGIGSIIVDMSGLINAFKFEHFDLTVTGLIGYNFLKVAACAFLIGIGSGIMIGVIRKIYNRFFVKRYILRKNR